MNNLSHKNQHTFGTSTTEIIDIKKVIFKYLHIWPYILFCSIIGILGAGVINHLSPKTVQISSTIQFLGNKNPFPEFQQPFSSLNNTSELTEANSIILKSYTHNEKVIKQLHLAVSYQENEFIKKNRTYMDSPFIVEWDYSHVQSLNIPFQITPVSKNKINIQSSFPEGNIILFNYEESETLTTQHSSTPLNSTVHLGQWIESPYYKFKIVHNPRIRPSFLETAQLGAFSERQHSITFKFNNYSSTFNKINSNLTINSISDKAPIIKLQLKGQDSKFLADYLNSSILIFRQDQLKEKNQMAINTVNFIDNEISFVKDSLIAIQNALENSKNKNNLIDLSSQANYLFESYSTLDLQEAQMKSQLEQYDLIKQKLDKSTSFDINIPALFGESDPVITQNLQELSTIHSRKNQLSQSLSQDNPVIIDLNNQIYYSTNKLSDIINTSITTLKLKIENQNKQKEKLKEKFNNLPFAEQAVLNVKRKHNLIESNYNYLMKKQTEAQILIAANVSDIKIIEPARSESYSRLAPRRSMNYLVGILLGIIVPIAYVLLENFFHSKVHSIEDIQKFISTPILGIIGHSSKEEIPNHLEPGSLLDENYRSLRKNCDDEILKIETTSNQSSTGKGKTILVTSLTQGEGKSFSAINLAKSYALGTKKTIILSADLRNRTLHQRIHSCNNNQGLSEYLNGSITQLDKIIQKTTTTNLHFISSGLKQQNPGELILNEKIEQLINKLKESYDYIIIDTPPIGLIADAKYIMPYSDINLHVIRHRQTPINLIEQFSNLNPDQHLSNYHYILNDVVNKNRNFQIYGMAYNYGYSFGSKYEYAH